MPNSFLCSYHAGSVCHEKSVSLSLSQDLPKPKDAQQLSGAVVGLIARQRPVGLTVKAS